MQGLQFYQLGQFQQAVQSFTKVIEKYPQFGDAFFYRGSSYLYLKDYKNTRKDLDQAGKLLKNNADVLLHYGYLYNETGEYKKAIKSFNQALVLKPGFAPAYNARGYSNQRLGNYRAALADYSSAINSDSTFALAYNNRGSAIYYNQDVAEPTKQDIRLAIKDFTKALKLEPKFCLARRNKGLAYSFLEQYDSAIAEITQAIACEPQNITNYVVRGSINIRKENYQEALNDFTVALEQDENLTEALIEMGVAKAYLGFTDEANKDFEQAIRTDPKYSATAYYGMAIAAAKNNNKDKMLKYLEEVRKTGYFSIKSNQKRLAEEKAFKEFKNDKDFRAFQVKLK
ncbi:MAG: tetratricopeptide repeat protein [Bacteroidia bacterium]